MLQKYVIINEADDQLLEMYNYYWGYYIEKLPAIPSKLHNGIDQKAAILNIWLMLIDVDYCKTLKANRTFSHSFVYRLHRKTLSCILGNSPLLLYPKAYEYSFLYAYYFGIEILAFLEETFQEEPSLKRLLRGTNYYVLTDADIEPDHDIYKIIKHFYIKTFDPTLDNIIYTKMHSKVTDLIAQLYDVQSLLKHESYSCSI